MQTEWYYSHLKEYVQWTPTPWSKQLFSFNAWLRVACFPKACHVHMPRLCGTISPAYSVHCAWKRSSFSSEAGRELTAVIDGRYIMSYASRVLLVGWRDSTVEHSHFFQPWLYSVWEILGAGLGRLHSAENWGLWYFVVRNGLRSVLRGQHWLLGPTPHSQRNVLRVSTLSRGASQYSLVATEWTELRSLVRFWVTWVRNSHRPRLSISTNRITMQPLLS